MNSWHEVIQKCIHMQVVYVCVHTYAHVYAVGGYLQDAYFTAFYSTCDALFGHDVLQSDNRVPPRLEDLRRHEKPC